MKAIAVIGANIYVAIAPKSLQTRLKCSYATNILQLFQKEEVSFCRTYKTLNQEYKTLPPIIIPMFI